MEYRQIDKLGVAPSLLGFGCMRFPVHADGTINEPEAQKMLDHAFAQGVNYFDTAYPYHEGTSEPFVGRALKKMPRDQFFLASKLPMWEVKTLDDAKRLFELQLSRLDVTYLDFYMLHCMNQSYWDTTLNIGLLDYCEQLKAEGKIRFFGFSFHDDYQAFENIIKGYDWDFCQIQYNYMDTNVQAGDKGFALAEQLGVPIIVMEPIKGGNLSNLPPHLSEGFTTYNKDASISSWALRWVASKPSVKLILSGMSTMEQLQDNIDTLSPLVPLNAEEQQIIEHTAELIRKNTNNGCTQCGYCVPCPVGVDIPGCFALWNEYARYRHDGAIVWAYFGNMPETARADRCVSCGECLSKCPQKIAIPTDLQSVAECFAPLAPTNS